MSAFAMTRSAFAGGVPQLLQPSIIDQSREDPADSTTSHLQRVPPELRNKIYDLILTDDDATNIDITPWPAITETCQQIRAECLPIYLDNQGFVVTILEHDHSALLAWLDKFSALTGEEKRLVKGNLKISIEGDMLDCLMGTPTRAVLATNFAFWDTIIARMSTSGLSTTQVLWPGREDALASTSRHNTLEGKRRHKSGIEKWLLDAYVLTPLLRAHEFLDEQRPPGHMSLQMQQEWNRFGVKGYYNKYMAQHVARRGGMSSGQWGTCYRRWVLESGKLLFVKYAEGLVAVEEGMLG